MTKAKKTIHIHTNSLDHFAANKLEQIAHAGLTRQTRPIVRAEDMAATRNGENFISFADNDYLGLSMHPSVKEAAASAAQLYGGGSGASRLVTGDHILYQEVEERIARLKNTESALVFGSGFMANISIIPTLMGADDLIIADRLVHASMHAGIKLSGATLLLFDHNDVSSAAGLLKSHRHKYPHTLLLAEGIYSMDGDLAPIKDLATLAKNNDAWFMVDDAHGLGVVGEGKGSVHATNATGMVPLQMGTLSKAVGAYGGYLAASEAVISLMKNRARAFIYTTALPPATLAAANAALEIIETDKELVSKPVAHAQYFAKALNLGTPQSPIVPIIIGTAEEALKASQFLEEHGFIVTAFRPPTVPENTSRLRFCFSASHNKHDIDTLISLVKSLNVIGP